MKNILSKIWGMIAKVFASLNKKYDNMQEPSRTHILLAAGLGPWFVLSIIGFIIGHKGFNMIGIAWIVFLIIIRLWWVDGNLKNYLNVSQS